MNAWTSRTGRRWLLRPAEEAAVDAMAAALKLSPSAARVFVARGYTTAAAQSFLSPTLSHLHDPSLLLGADVAVDRIERAIRKGEHIRLVTDYDVDGTTSCLILHAALDRRLAVSGGAATISYHIPDRFTEGYGLSLRAVETAAADGVTLLITADIGVRDHASVRRAREIGVDVLICDHHLPPGDDVPSDAVAVICPPQKGCPYPNKALAACGVSLKLATALLRDDPRRDEVLGSLLKLAAVGTVADVVDLSTPENRAIVTLGLLALNQGKNAPGMSALLTVAGLRPGAITTSDLGFRIGPRINAAGRLKDANAVVRLLRERNPLAALDLANLLDSWNRQRQGIQEDLLKMVLAGIPQEPPSFLVVWGPEEEGWHRGVVGIVAGKVRERIHRPVAVVSVLGAVATGSIRSVPQVHAVRALDSVAPLLLRYGGHAAAAGFSLPSASLPAFSSGLDRYVREHHDDASLVPEDEVDLHLDARVPFRLVEELARLEPCGKGNQAPRVVIRGPLERVRIVKEKHLFFKVGGVEAKWWGEAPRKALLDGCTAVLGSLSVNDWDGTARVELLVEDVA